MLRVGAGCQRYGGVHRPFEVGHAGAQHGQRVLTPQVLVASGRAVVQPDGLRRQRCQPIQRVPHVALQPFPRLGLGAGALLALRHPRAQQLFGGREFHERRADVAGDAVLRDPAFCHVQCGRRDHAFENDSGGQQAQCNGEATAKHG